MKRIYNSFLYKRKPLFGSDKKETEYLQKLQDNENYIEYRKHILKYMEDIIHINWSYEKTSIISSFISFLFSIFVIDNNTHKLIGLFIGLIYIIIAIIFNEKNKKRVWEYTLVDKITKDLINQ